MTLLPGRSGRSRDPLRTALRLILSILLVGAALLLWPVSLGGSSTSVIVRGGSMQPTYDNGDLLLARTASTYDIGDVVVFRPGGAPDASLVVHRVVDVDADGRLVTRGDNRTTDDGFATELSAVVGAVRWRVPSVGKAVALLSRPWSLAILAGTLVAAYILSMATTPDPEDAQ